MGLPFQKTFVPGITVEGHEGNGSRAFAIQGPPGLFTLARLAPVVP
jgi:hypothetical protein